MTDPTQDAMRKQIDAGGDDKKQPESGIVLEVKDDSNAAGAEESAKSPDNNTEKSKSDAGNVQTEEDKGDKKENILVASDGGDEEQKYPPMELNHISSAAGDDKKSAKSDAGNNQTEEEKGDTILGTPELDDDREEEPVPKCLIKMCQYMWRAPVLPMIWLGVIFTLFWTVFGLLDDLENEYDKVTPTGCCGMIVDDITDPLTVDDIDGISPMCFLSNLTGDWRDNEKLFSVQEEVDEVGNSEKVHFHCVNRAPADTPYDCNEGVEQITIVECLARSTLTADDICSKSAINNAFDEQIKDKMVERFMVLRAYSLLVLFFTLVLFCTSIYLWNLIPATTKGGHTTFHLCQIFLYIMPSMALIVFILIMYGMISLDSWLDPYDDTGVISLDSSNNAQTYVSVNCANTNNVIFLDADETVSNSDNLDESAEAIQSVLTVAGILCAWPIINCVMGMTITGGDLCLASAD